MRFFAFIVYRRRKAVRGSAGVLVFAPTGRYTRLDNLLEFPVSIG